MKKNFEIPNELLKPPKVGEIVEGKIIDVGKSAVYLDLGPFGTGIIYGKEFYEGKEALKELEIGDNLFAKIINLDNEKGYVELSISQAKEELTWQKLAKKKEQEETIKVKILGANKGGVLTNISGIPAFLPVSQLSSEHYPRVEGGDETEILKELKKFVGKELEVKILDLSKKEGKLILSEKAKEMNKIKEILKNYKVGDTVEGEITAILDFGAFIKFPLPADLRRPKPTTVGEGRSKKVKADAVIKGEPASAEAPAGEGLTLEGLIHISELDWQLIEDPSEVVKVGEEVKAKIISISNGKVSLSLKALKEDPWKNFGKKHKVGEIISGEVTKFNPFGAFVKINDRIQGLIHISEFGSEEKMKQALQIRKKYDFEVLSIEPGEHRLSLKLKK